MKTVLLYMFLLPAILGIIRKPQSFAEGGGQPVLSLAAAAKGSPAKRSSPKTEAGIVLKGDISVYIRFSGTSTAEDFFYVNAPFTGRTEEVMGKLFQWVNTDTLLARIVSIEMAALIDATPRISKRQTGKRWKKVFDYYDLHPQESGIIAHVYAHPKERIHPNERMFTVARKIVVIGKTMEPVYCPILPGQNARLESIKAEEESLQGLSETARQILRGTGESIKVKAVVEWVLPPKDGVYRVGLKVTTLKDGLGPGMAFHGRIHLGTSKNTMLVPRESVIKKGGKNYVILEVRTGLSNADETEITRGAEPGRFFIR